MASLKIFLSAILATPALAQILYATSYNDHAVTTLKLDGGNLTTVSKSYDCGSEPTWLTLDYANKILYCLNEGWGGNASLTSYRTSSTGGLAVLDILPTLKSPVASTIFGPYNSGLAVAFYDTGAFATYKVGDPSDLSLLKQEQYTLPAPGPVPDRQDAPHLHDAILDPTGSYIVVPDLGSDLLRVYRIGVGKSTTQVTTVKAVPGSGPRHGAFAVVGGKTYFYNVNELSNTISAYSVVYKTDKPVFTRISDFSTHGPGGSVPAGTKSAELVVSPDNRFVLLTSRGENLAFPNPNPNNPETVVADPLITFSIAPRTGQLTLLQITSAGGRNPRGFSLNKAGTLVVSALQDDNRVVVINRDVRTGLVGKVAASATVGVGAGNGPNYALFYE